MEVNNKINLHSEELQEVLGTPPNWLVRFGTLIAFFTFFVLIIVAYFVKYPDVIKAPLVITALNPPVNLISKRSGRLEAVLIKDNDHVKKGDLLLVYSSTANLFDIDSLEKDLAYFAGELSVRDIENFTPRRALKLGDLQDEYSEFLKNFDGFIYGAVSNNDQKSINRKRNDIRSIEGSIILDNEKRPGIQKRSIIAQKELKRFQDVYASNPEKYRDLLGEAISKVNDIDKEFEDLETTILNKRAQIERIKRSIAEIRQQSGEDNSNLKFEIEENISRLKGKINIWKNENLILAPIEGRVIFYEEFDNENQSVEEGTKILRILPPGEVGEMYGKVDLPQTGSAKVEIGQIVAIKMKNYPFHEYGILKGVVRKKADIPQENNTYKLEVELVNGLQTNFGKNLDFAPGMIGSAEIITKERRFLNRIFENVFIF